jgi:hypothetical protein
VGAGEMNKQIPKGQKSIPNGAKDCTQSWWDLELDISTIAENIMNSLGFEIISDEDANTWHQDYQFSKKGWEESKSKIIKEIRSLSERCKAQRDLDLKAQEEEYTKHLEMLHKRWDVPKDEFGYINTCRLCKRPCMESDEDICFNCNFAQEKQAKDIFKTFDSLITTFELFMDYPEAQEEYDDLRKRFNQRKFQNVNR